MKRIAIAGALGLSLLSGCVMPQSGTNEVRYVRVESDPPGARIVNVGSGLFMCNAPCTISQLNYWGSGPMSVSLKALPTRAQDCVQSQLVSYSNMAVDQAQAPTIFFSMKACNVNRNLNGTMDGN